MRLAPERRLEPEILDDPTVPDAVRVRSLADVARSNVVFGGRRALLRALAAALPAPGSGGTLTLLDVGTGTGDLAQAARAMARARGVQLRTIGLDVAPSLARVACGRADWVVCADALHLPFATASVDLVTCSQLLHHFTEKEGLVLLAELDRVARRRVIVSDLRRSRLASWGFWLASFPLRFHPVTRHDGRVSVMRGFTAGELASLVRRATGEAPRVRRALGWRLTASWTPTGVRTGGAR